MTVKRWLQYVYRQAADWQRLADEQRDVYELEVPS